MCYTCSPSCDNCMPKMLFCPECGERNLLAYEECCSCGAPLEQEAKDYAVAEWHAGKKFSLPEPPPFVLEMRRKLQEAEVEVGAVVASREAAELNARVGGDGA